ncbi:MAG: APC family permease, partial [Clostridiaceae bacterium]|nr:APC family permease [Clostridiaceae bacterium]
MESKIEKLLIGEALKTEELKGEKFSKFWGLPILSSDAISSVAYAAEEILIAFIFVLGIRSYQNLLYVSLCIVFLLFLIVFSYRQTIDNYPLGGGSYIVSKDNLGTIPSLTAASALSIDYILTVAVSVSAGTAAIYSAFPSLYQYKVIIAIFLVLLLTLGNLRGIKDSAKLFGLPAYFFIAIIGSMIVTGIVKHAMGIPPAPGQEIPPQIENISFFLFLKAFASGCSALTGIEAVSDGIPNFQEPSQKNAKTVLMLLGGIVLFIFGGISYLANIYHP